MALEVVRSTLAKVLPLASRPTSLVCRLLPLYIVATVLGETRARLRPRRHRTHFLTNRRKIVRVRAFTKGLPTMLKLTIDP